MRFIHIYLIGYFILILGAGLALWQAGVLARISPTWIAISAVAIVAPPRTPGSDWPILSQFA